MSEDVTEIPDDPAPTICESCGAELLKAKFCPECGTPVKQPPPTCAGCGHQPEAVAKFCPECGAQLALIG